MKIDMRVLRFIFVLVSFRIADGKIDGSIFAEELNRVADAVGMSEMQRYYDEQIYSESALSGPQLVKEISQTLSGKFDNMKEALDAIRSEIESSYSSYIHTTSIKQCCNVGEASFDTRFRAEVLFNEMCVAISGQAKTDYKIPSEALLTVFKENHNKNPNLLWQYFGGEDGVYVNYPATKLTNCDSYDPRYRPYFASTAAPKHKDVVIVLDTSHSMRQTFENTNLLQIAKEAAINVIQTLNEEDRIGIVTFGDEPNTPESADHPCYKNKLALATHRNVDFLKRYINGRGTEGQTNYEKALIAAFTYFESSESTLSGESRDRILLFMSDGDNDGERSALDVIKEENERLNNTVVIHTYGLGTDLSSQEIQLLQDMSKQVLNNASYGQIQAGQCITDTAQIRTAVGSYYLFFSTDFSANPVFSKPYIDLFSGIGLIISMCVPINTNGKFIGVACTDIKLSEMVSEISYFQQGEHSYAFMIDGYGTTLVHPLLPQLRERVDNSDIVDIHNFERSRDVSEVIDSMKSGGNGTKSLQAMRVISRGVILKEGDFVKHTQAQYSWTSVDKSNFSVCVVIEAGDTRKVLADITPTRELFMYHNRAVSPGSYKNCRHYARLATTDKTAVMLTPNAFKDPYAYIFEPETASVIKRYEDYFTGQTLTNPGFKTTVINSVAATYKLQSIWKSNEEAAKYIIWRYICTEDGVVRMYPGVQLTKDYDNKLRPWYIRTVAQKKTNVISAPYFDAWGSGYLITLSKVIFKGRSSGEHLANDTTTGVMGTDFPINYFNQLLRIKYPECRNASYTCLVIDNSGFLVMHPSFVETSEDPDLKDLVHITSKEKEIAEDLIKEGVLYRSSCLTVENQKEQFTYRVSLSGSQGQADGLDRMSSVGYEIRPVQGSNIFIILKRASRAGTCCSNSCTKEHTYCDTGPRILLSHPNDTDNQRIVNPYISPDQTRCGTSQCDCLCYKDVEGFSNCENEYSSSETGSSPCSARIAALTSVSTLENVTGLPTCFDSDCFCRTSVEDCYSVAGCSWCSESKSGTLLEEGFCDLQETCPFRSCKHDKCGSQCPNKQTNPPTTSESSQQIGIIIGACGGGLVVLIVVVVIILIKTCKGEKDDTYLDAYHSREDLEINENSPHGKRQEGFDNIPDSPPPKYDTSNFQYPGTGSDSGSVSGSSNPYVTTAS